MINYVKRMIRNRIKHRLLRLPETPTDRLNIPATLNENFNLIIALNPRVTSFQEHVALFAISGMAHGDIIEVGCYLCYSSVLMASAFSSANRKVYAIDLFNREKGWQGGGADAWIYRDFSQLEFAEKIIAESGLADSIQVMQGRSDELVNQLIDLPNVGLVFIDGDHSFEGCKSDLMNYAPLLRKGGLLVMDDYASTSHPGVKGAVDEFLIQNPEFHAMFLVGSMLVLGKQS